MKSALFTILSLPLCLQAFADCPTPQLPAQFNSRQALISIGTDMYMTGPNRADLGLVMERTFRLTTTFDYVDHNKQKIATARKRALSIGTAIDVFDCENKKIGTIQENVVSSLFGGGIYTTYEIYDAEGKKVATSEKVQWGNTTFDIKGEAGKSEVVMTRPWTSSLTGIDNWNITINKDSKIDPRIFVMIPAFKTAGDTERRAAEKKKQERADANSDPLFQNANFEVVEDQDSNSNSGEAL